MGERQGTMTCPVWIVGLSICTPTAEAEESRRPLAARDLELG
jgi:hypothetical protein